MPTPFKPSPPEPAAEPKKSNNKFTYTHYSPPPLPPASSSQPLIPPPPQAWNPRSGSSDELVQEPFPTPYSELKNYDGSTGSGKGALGEIGWPVFVVILVIVLLILGISAGVTINVRRG
ncbi:hypothetical protein NA56DRAFT_648901 [Hyaloscypha hepaticicola]|uniref:Uncharacterized protein n=1 Tax=Hyaloscypha hepaticicola TaxID=2082293 RepID=A0A2J6PT13_9HELO|nr:hypothetical protein NA56DRAFT_648901 [Hyaloscypha hepaticicola]